MITTLVGEPTIPHILKLVVLLNILLLHLINAQLSQLDLC